MRARRLVVLMAMLVPGGCDYIAPPDPLALDPDVISIAIVLVAGESQAHLLAGHPHRPASDPPPRVTASLVGPDWRIAFTSARDLSGCRGGPTDLPFPKICLHAALPEPIRERGTYKLDGEGPQGSFAGETVVPAAPRVLDPGDTVWLPDSIRTIRIPIRYRAPPEVGTLRPEMFATLSDSTGTESRWMSVSPWILDVNGQADTLLINRHYEKKVRQASLHLLGIGWHYTNFRRWRGIRFPWPNFGVSGEGVYGYFDGSAKSRRVHIIVEDGG